MAHIQPGGTAVRWATLLALAMVVSVALAFTWSLGGNYGGAAATLAFVASSALFLLPFAGFWLMWNAYLRDAALTYATARTTFVAGVIVWACLFGVLILLARAEGQSSLALQVAWPLLSILIFVLPLGARLLAATGTWRPRHALAACIAATTISALMLTAGLLAPRDALLNAGPLPAFLFSGVLVLLYLANLGLVPVWVWMLGHGVSLLAALSLSHFIFFQGVFYGGGIAPLLVFSVAMLASAVAGTLHRGLRRPPKYNYGTKV